MSEPAWGTKGCESCLTNLPLLTRPLLGPYWTLTRPLLDPYWTLTGPLLDPTGPYWALLGYRELYCICWLTNWLINQLTDITINRAAFAAKCYGFCYLSCLMSCAMGFLKKWSCHFQFPFLKSIYHQLKIIMKNRCPSCLNFPEFH